MFKCFLCDFTTSLPKALISHIKSSHVTSTINRYVCKTFQCGQHFSTLYSFANHLKRVHFKTSESLPCNTEQPQTFSGANASSADAFSAEMPTCSSFADVSMNSDSETDTSKIIDLNSFILSLHYKSNFNRKDVFEIVDKVQEMILKPIHLSIINSITPIIADSNNRLSVENQLTKLFSSLQSFKSEHKFFKSLETANILKMPTQFIINEEVCEIVQDYEPGLHANKTTGVLMPIKFQFQKYFESPNVLKETNNFFSLGEEISRNNIKKSKI